MAEPTPPLRTIAWNEVFPWFLLARALSLATSAPVLLVATVGVLLLPLGWELAALLLPPDSAPAHDALRRQMPIVTEADVVVWQERVSPHAIPQPRWPASWRAFVSPMLQVLPGGVQPLRRLFATDASWGELGYVAVGTLWNICVWGFFGAMIVRIAVMQFGRQERIGLVDAGRFAASRYRAFVGAPLFPLVLLAVLVVFALPVGWLLRADWGPFLAALLWIFVLLGALLAAVLYVGVVVGWPLMWGALSTEEMGDVFEATQRAFSYTFGRPLHYAWYALVTVLVGSAAFIAVEWLAELIVYMSFYLVSWGAGSDALHALRDPAGWQFGPRLVAWLSQLVLTVASAFRYAYFWCAVGAIYLLLRRDSDQIDWDIVHVPDQPVRYALPPLTTDEAGVPGVDEE